MSCNQWALVNPVDELPIDIMKFVFNTKYRVIMKLVHFASNEIEINIQVLRQDCSAIY